MKIVFVMLVVMCGCELTANNTKVINLTADEKKQSISLAEHRQDIGFRRQKATNDFQSAMNRLAEEEGSVNLDSSKLCFELKKAHKLDPDSQYQLDEWKGQLVKR